MDIVGFVGLGILIVMQIVYFAYTFGRLNGKINSIDKSLNDLSYRYGDIEQRVGKLEGRK